MKALVFGGAFNPPTNAHIQLAKYAMEQVGAQKVIFVPTKQSYVLQEQRKDSSFTDIERLHMLEKIAKSNPWMVISDYEISQNCQPRTYETLCYLKNLGYEISLLFGLDKLLELETGWLHIDEICEQFGIVCMTRSNDDIDAMIENSSYLKERKQYITIVHTPENYQMISSTKVRKMISALRTNENQPEIQKQLDLAVPKELNGMKEYL